MAPVVISFSDKTTTPPVYVAGSFTNWQPVEITPSPAEIEGQYTYEKVFDLVPGTYQYKFRLGPGDWWVCDSVALKDRDASGNENNFIVVEAEPIKVVPEYQKPILTSVPAPLTNGTKSVPEKPIVNGITKPEPLVATSEPKLPTKEKKEPAAPIDVPKVESVPAAKEIQEFKPSVETKKVESEPAKKAVEEVPAPKPAAKEVDSKGTSVSSLSPKEGAAVKKESAPEKLSWFARIFLCGSSRKMMLAAAVISVPVLLAFFIQK